MNLVFETETSRWDAVKRRDKVADGHFVYSVLTTGVYCRPSCASRPKRRENVAFHPTPREAERMGYRPCRRCRPNEAPREARETELVATACRAIETADAPPSLATLAMEVGLSPYHFHRVFKRVAGVTPRGYAAAVRQRRMRDALAANQPVTSAVYEAGFNSSGRFYENSNRMLGMTPTEWKRGGQGTTIWHAVGRSTLGNVLVAATDKGIAAILIGDDTKPLEVELKRRFPKADHVAPPQDFTDWIAQVVGFVDDPRQGCALPLDIRGTAFQRRVWQELCRIPAGETATYGQIARRIGKPAAVRAVGTACGANHIAVAIPCHRAVGADGGLTGYRWGIERKRRLLEREKS